MHICKVLPSYPETKNMKNAIKIMYDEKKSYSCDVCQKTFTTRGNLKAHKHINTGEPQFSCDICNEKFHQRNHMLAHRHSNSLANTGPFECKICYKVFNTKAHLIEHRIGHSKIKAYQCNVCLKSFKRKSSLTKHQHLHTGKLDSACDICNKIFSTRNNMLHHRNVHTREKQFTCSCCAKSFNSTQALFAHRKSKHPNYNVESKLFVESQQCEICEKFFNCRTFLLNHKKKHIERKVTVDIKNLSPEILNEYVQDVNFDREDVQERLVEDKEENTELSSGFLEVNINDNKTVEFFKNTGEENQYQQEYLKYLQSGLENDFIVTEKKECGKTKDNLTDNNMEECNLKVMNSFDKSIESSLNHKGNLIQGRVVEESKEINNESKDSNNDSPDEFCVDELLDGDDDSFLEPMKIEDQMIHDEDSDVGENLINLGKDSSTETKRMRLKGIKEVFVTARGLNMTSVKEGIELKRLKTQDSDLKWNLSKRNIPETMSFENKNKWPAKTINQNAIINQQRRYIKNAFPCNVCFKTYDSYVDLGYHIKEEEATHTDLRHDKKPICTLCGNSFTRFHTLMQHTRQHLGILPYYCDLCGNVFASNAILWSHMKSRHRNKTKDYKSRLSSKKRSCDELKITKQISKDVKNNEESYSCEICSKSFKDLEDCIKHEQTHRKKLYRTSTRVFDSKYLDEKEEDKENIETSSKAIYHNNSDNELITETDASPTPTVNVPKKKQCLKSSTETKGLSNNLENSKLKTQETFDNVNEDKSDNKSLRSRKKRLKAVRKPKLLRESSGRERELDSYKEYTKNKIEIESKAKERPLHRNSSYEEGHTCKMCKASFCNKSELLKHKFSHLRKSEDQVKKDLKSDFVSSTEDLKDTRACSTNPVDVYKCPVDSCAATMSHEELKNGSAVNHMIKIHQIFPHKMIKSSLTWLKA